MGRLLSSVLVWSGVPAFDMPATTAEIMEPLLVPSSKDGVTCSREYVVDKVQVSIILWVMMEKTF